MSLAVADFAMRPYEKLRPFEAAGARISNPLRTRYGSPHPKPRKWIVDVDGTLMLRLPGGRGPYDWSRVDEDVPNDPVVEVVRALGAAGESFLVVSGRLEVCRDATVYSLQRHVFSPTMWSPVHLFMRDEARQYMPDDELKYELYTREIMPFFEIAGVFDDRDRVVDMWRRKAGLPCFQVADGNF